MKPEVIKWDYDASVKEANQNRRKKNGLDEDFVRILWLARENLSQSKSEAAKILHGTHVPRRTWDNYCEDINIEKRTANRWLERYDSKAQVLISEIEWKEKKKEKQVKKEKKAIEISKNKTESILHVNKPVVDITETTVEAPLAEKTCKADPVNLPSASPNGDSSSEKAIDSGVEIPGELPPDCFSLSRELLEKLLKYKFANAEQLKILLYVMLKSYGAEHRSKYTHEISDEEFVKEIAYPHTGDIGSELKLCVKAGLIDKKDNAYFIKKDEKLWSNINGKDKKEKTQKEKDDFVKIKEAYFDAFKIKGVTSPLFGKKEGYQIYLCLKYYDVDTLLKMMKIYFERDEFSKFYGCSLGGFYSQLNKLKLALKTDGKRFSKITGQEYKDVGF